MTSLEDVNRFTVRDRWQHGDALISSFVMLAVHSVAYFALAVGVLQWRDARGGLRGLLAGLLRRPAS